MDHEPLPYPTPPAFATFFDPAYHGVVSYLHDRLAGIVGARAPQLAGHVWLSEANSVCHQGTFNVTNAFANSLWLLDRLGLMATAGVQLMARQSLIGCVCVLHCTAAAPAHQTRRRRRAQFYGHAHACACSHCNNICALAGCVRLRLLL